jgi:hypothetical protein
MRIINKTHYPTRALRSVVLRAYREVARTEGPAERWGSTKITVVHARGGLCSGWAYRGGTRAHLRVPRQKVNAGSLYGVAWHEVMHLRGFAHGTFPHYPTHEQTVRALCGLPEYIEATPPTKPARRVPTPADHIARIEARLARWVSKRRRAETAIRKLLKSRRYYERKMAAGRAPAEGEPDGA